MAGDEGMNAGMADFGVRTVAEDNYWDRTGLTASIGECDTVDDPEPAGYGSDMDDQLRRPLWMPVEGT